MKLKIAFDVDDTLIIPAVATGFDIDVPNYETIAIYKWFQSQGNYMIIWSGGGKDYAEMWATKLGLQADEILAKDTCVKSKIDIAFDDSDVELGKVNVKVQRLNNKIIRYPDKIVRKKKKKIVVPDETTKEQKEINKQVSTLIDLFQYINPSYVKFFSHKVQRAAIERLIALPSLGYSQVEKAILVLQKTNGMPYAPVIISPVQLENKIASLIAFVKKEKLKASNPKGKQIL